MANKKTKLTTKERKERKMKENQRILKLFDRFLNGGFPYQNRKMYNNKESLKRGIPDSFFQPLTKKVAGEYETADLATIKSVIEKGIQEAHDKRVAICPTYDYWFNMAIAILNVCKRAGGDNEESIQVARELFIKISETYVYAGGIFDLTETEEEFNKFVVRNYDLPGYTRVYRIFELAGIKLEKIRKRKNSYSKNIEKRFDLNGYIDPVLNRINFGTDEYVYYHIISSLINFIKNVKVYVRVPSDLCGENEILRNKRRGKNEATKEVLLTLQSGLLDYFIENVRYDNISVEYSDEHVAAFLNNPPFFISKYINIYKTGDGFSVIRYSFKNNCWDILPSASTGLEIFKEYFDYILYDLIPFLVKEFEDLDYEVKIENKSVYLSKILVLYLNIVKHVLSYDFQTRVLNNKNLLLKMLPSVGEGDVENRNKNRFYFTNGVLNLETMKFEDPDPESFNLRSCGYPYTEKIDDEIERAVEETINVIKEILYQNVPIGEDPEIYFKEFIKLTERAIRGLSPSETNRAFNFLYGEGGNGKSTLINFVNGILGSYLTDIRALSLSDKSEMGKDLFRAIGSRMLVISEAFTNSKKVDYDFETIKSLVGGDSISCRTLFSKPVSYRFYSNVLIVSNNLPNITDRDVALKDRYVVFPIEKRFIDSKTVEERNRVNELQNLALSKTEKGIMYRCALLRKILKLAESIETDKSMSVITKEMKELAYTRVHAEENVLPFFGNNAISVVDLETLEVSLVDIEGTGVGLSVNELIDPSYGGSNDSLSSVGVPVPDNIFLMTPLGYISTNAGFEVSSSMNSSEFKYSSTNSFTRSLKKFSTLTDSVISNLSLDCLKECVDRSVNSLNDIDPDSLNSKDLVSFYMSITNLNYKLNGVFKGKYDRNCFNFVASNKRHFEGILPVLPVKKLIELSSKHGRNRFSFINDVREVYKNEMFLPVYKFLMGEDFKGEFNSAVAKRIVYHGFEYILKTVGARKNKLMVGSIADFISDFVSRSDSEIWNYRVAVVTLVTFCWLVQNETELYDNDKQ